MNRHHDSGRTSCTRLLAQRQRVVLAPPAVVLLLVSASGVPAQSRIETSVFPRSPVVTIPVVDKQDIRFKQLTTNGEPFSPRVQATTQDHTGFIWLGTDDAGLFRYDGYSLKSYRHDPSSPNSLRDNRVRAAFRDRDGALWVGGGNLAGLDRLNPASDTFTHYLHDPRDERSLSDNGVTCLYQDRSGVIWVGTRGGLNRLEPPTGTVVRYYPAGRDAGSLSSNNISSILEDRSGNLWLGTRAGLLKLDRASGRFSRFLYDPHSIDHDFVSSIWEDHAGVLWLGLIGDPGLRSLDSKTGKFTRYAFHLEHSGEQIVATVSCLYEDRGGSLWAGTIGGGVLKLNRERTQAFRYRRQPANPNSLHNDEVVSISEDREGILWLGTAGGSSRFSTGTLPFLNYQQSKGDPKGLNGSYIASVQGDNEGFLWFGNYRGLIRLDRKTGQEILFQHDPRNAHSLSANQVFAIRQGQPGELWIATSGGGLNRLDLATQQFTTYRHDPKDPASVSSDFIICLLLDRQGILWLGTKGAGLNRFDSKTGQFTRYQYDPASNLSLVDSIKAICEDRAGILWLATQGGLNRFDPRTGKFTLYRHDPQNPSSVSHYDVTAVLEDPQQRLWVGTANGLNVLDRTRGTFTVLTTKDGLPDDNIEGILEDGHGDLWLATHNGLSRFHPPTKTFRNYSEADGLPNASLNPSGQEAAWRSQDGEMVFGSRNGLITFYPDRFSSNPDAPPVVLTDFHLFNKPVLPGGTSPLHKPIWSTDSLALDYTQSIFTLEFAGLSYAAPEKTRYRYRLAGLEPDWNEVDSRRRQQTYTSLPPGHYNFLAQAASVDGVWNEKGVKLAITVLPPWWATWWFRSIVGIAIIGAMVTGYKVRIRGMRLSAVRLEAQVAQRTRELAIAKEAAEHANKAKSTFLATMSHELRTPLNAILGFSAMVRDSRGLAEEHRRDLDIVNRSGEHLLELINDVLDMAKVEAGRTTLEIAPCDAGRLASDIADMMRSRAAAKNVELRLVQSPHFPVSVWTDGPKLRQVLVNLVGNAVKYTQRGSVTLRLDGRSTSNLDDVRLIFEVVDTGVGIAPEDQERIFEPFVQLGRIREQKGTGLGLAISREFVALMGGAIQVESTPGQGSLFRLELPAKLAEKAEVEVSLDERKYVLQLDPGEAAKRILVVDDQTDNRLLLQRLLQNAGFQVEVAADGAQAVEMFRNWQPHFIWMDWRMPVMDGAEATQRIRELDGGRQVKIVAATASAYASEYSQVLSAGMDDLVRKPFRTSVIFECMARFLGVRYRSDGAISQPSAELPVIAMPKALRALPDELRGELRAAVVTLNRDRISAAIERISKIDPALADALSQFTERLAYTTILDATEV